VFEGIKKPCLLMGLKKPSRIWTAARVGTPCSPPVAAWLLAVPDDVDEPVELPNDCPLVPNPLEVLPVDGLRVDPRDWPSTFGLIHTARMTQPIEMDVLIIAAPQRV
jgi:hypothetical protein